MSAKTWILAGAAVAAVGTAAWMYKNKWSKEDDWLNRRSDDLETAEDRLIDSLNRPRAKAVGTTPRGRLAQVPRTGTLAFLSTGEPTPMDSPYGCDAFERYCTPGDVGGCESLRQSCATKDNTVRVSMARPGECDQFRTQCMQGDYGSCDMYARACQYEGN